MKNLNLFQYYNEYRMDLTADEILEKYEQQCGHWNRNTLLQY